MQTEAPAPPVRMTPRAVRVLVIVVIVLVVLGLVVTFVHRRENGAAAGHRVTVPLNGLSSADVLIDSGADRISVTTADLGGDLATVTTPNGVTVHPRTQVTGSHLRIWTENDANAGTSSTPVEIDVRIDSGVRWDVVVAKGAKQIALNLGSGQIHSLGIQGGADHADVVLPRPKGDVVTRVTTGLGSAAFHVPNGVPVQLTLGSGAGSVVVDGQQHQGVAAGATINGTQGDTAAADKLSFDISAGVGTVTLDRSAP